MFDQPRAKGGWDQGGIGGFFGDRELFLLLKRRLNVFKERNWERVAFMKVRKIGVKACEGVLVGKEARVGEFPAKDCER